jgi:hypothetical protein
VNERRLHSALGLLYGLGALILLEQFSEVVITALANAAVTPGNAVWRYGMVGSTVGRTTVLVVADLLIGMAAIGRGNDRFLKVWGWLHAIGAVVLALLMVNFALDFLTVRRLAAAAAKRNVTLTGLRALVVGLVLAVTMMVAGLRMIAIARYRRTATRPTIIVSPISTHG